MTVDHQRQNPTSPPLITVLITAYNYGRFIEECIDSVLTQDYPPDKMEIVVVDDGSTDDTAERVKKYGSKIHYLYKSNGGQASALNLGFAKARGEIISLLDADDFFLPGKLACVADIFQRDPSLGMIYHPYLEFDMETNERRESQFPLISGSPFENLAKFEWYAGQGTSASFRRRFLNCLLPIPEELRMIADSYIATLMPFIAPIFAVPQCLSAYRFHGRNSYHADEKHLSVDTRKKRLQMWQISIRAMRKWLVDNGYRRNQAVVRCFHRRWTLFLDGMQFAIERMQFAIEPPGRMRFLGHFLKYNYWYRKSFGWRFQAVNYINAFIVLASGYKHLGSIERAEQALIRAFRRFTKRLPSTS